MPAVRALARQIVLHLGEAVIIPLGLFYVVLLLAGLWPALAASAGWAALAITFHLVRGGSPSALLVATGGLAALQIGLTAAARSPVVFFLQPTAATYLFAVAMLATAWRHRPLIERLAADFCPMPEDFLESPVMRRFFTQLSWVWATVLGGNATLTLVLLLTISTTWAVPASTAGSLPLFALGLGISYSWFRRAVQRGGFALVWGADPAPQDGGDEAA